MSKRSFTWPSTIPNPIPPGPPRLLLEKASQFLAIYPYYRNFPAKTLQSPVAGPHSVDSTWQSLPIWVVFRVAAGVAPMLNGLQGPCKVTVSTSVDRVPCQSCPTASRDDGRSHLFANCCHDPVCTHRSRTSPDVLTRSRLSHILTRTDPTGPVQFLFNPGLS